MCRAMSLGDKGIDLGPLGSHTPIAQMVLTVPLGRHARNARVVLLVLFGRHNEARQVIKRGRSVSLAEQHSGNKARGWDKWFLSESKG